MENQYHIMYSYHVENLIVVTKTYNT